MIIFKKALLIILCLCTINSQAYGFTKIMESSDESDIKSNIKEKYGINIIIALEDEGLDYKECMLVVERSLRRFPEGEIKEITDSYAKNEISTNVIINKAEIVKDLFSEYNLTDHSANLYINALPSSLYSDSCVASGESLLHELGHFVSEYIFKTYGYEKLKADFENLNEGYEYGLWEDDYSNAFISKHSAVSFDEEVADLIWYTEVHPEALRNMSGGEHEIIHEKVEFLADVIDQCFDSITEESRLWMESVPQKPDEWAEDSIAFMKNTSLIPEKFDGMYDAYITREDFYTLISNIIESKLGEETFNKSFNIAQQEEHVILDPVKGEISMDDGMNYMFTDGLLCNNKELIYEAYQMGLTNQDGLELSSESYMTRLEIAKVFNCLGNKLGMDISDYDTVYYDDISDVKESEIPFIYYVTSIGILKGDGTSFKPYDNCTYQEAYIMIMRFYNLL